MTTKVSIVIPVKAVNDFLRQETIPALLKQTYQNLEIIIVTDFVRNKVLPKAGSYKPSKESASWRP